MPLIIRLTLVLLPFCTVCTNSYSYEYVRTPLIIAVQKEGSQEIRSLIESTLKSLSQVERTRVPELRYLSLESLKDQSSLKDIDYLIASASVFAALEKYSGLKAVASVKPAVSFSADHASSTAILVDKQNLSVKTLKDLKGKTIGLPAQSSPEERVQVLNEFKMQGFKESDFATFKRISGEYGKWLKDLKNGSIDALALDPLAFRKLPESIRMRMNLLEPRIKDDYILGHTTATYPGWVMAATLKAGKKETVYLEAFLKSLRPVEGLSWAPQADYRQTHQVLTSLDDPFYKSFKKRTWREIVEENLVWWALAGVVLFSWLLHTLFTNRLVNMRTRQLFEANERRLKAEEHYHNLEKASIVGQMSNIVAHELRQPLAAISNYSLAMKRRLSKGNLDEDALSFAISKLLAESGRASEIIEHVQRYAKGKPSDWKNFSVSELLKPICENYRDSQDIPLVRFYCREEQNFIGDPLEIELVARNLVKNAIEATSCVKDPQILLELCPENGGVRITVADNGPQISDEALVNLREPLKSTKIGGLGLGLSIVKRICESYEGHVEFSKNSPTGLKVTVWLYSKVREER